VGAAAAVGANSDERERRQKGKESKSIACVVLSNFSTMAVPVVSQHHCLDDMKHIRPV